MIRSIFFNTLAVFLCAIYFNVPRRSAIPVMLTSLSGILVQIFIDQLLAIKYLSILLAIMTIGFVAGFFARRQKLPTTIYLQAGIIPLVPGRALYRMMYYFVFQDYNKAIMFGAESVIIAGILAIGIYITSVISDEIKFRIYNIKNRRVIRNEEN